jgi:hypothetical protein
MDLLIPEFPHRSDEVICRELSSFLEMRCFPASKVGIHLSPSIQLTDKKGGLAIESEFLIRVKRTIIIKQRRFLGHTLYILSSNIVSVASTKTGVWGRPGLTYTSHTAQVTYICIFLKNQLFG